MNFLRQKLLTDPQTATGDSAHPEQFHFTWQWLAFCGIILLIWFYYQVEGRRRFFGNNWLNKSIFDRLLNQYALAAFVGPFIWFARVAMDSSFFLLAPMAVWLAAVAGGPHRVLVILLCLQI